MQQASAQQIDRLKAVALKPAPELPVKADQALVGQSLSYLASKEAFDSIAADAYWPKWNGPWWHMLLLHEMGLTGRIPEAVVERIVSALESDYLTFFPFTADEVPSGVDPLNQVACHCQLGTMHQLLTAYGVDVDARLPWVRPWYVRYQLDDGGLNCDEAAYTKAVRKSSVVSTVPALEAVLTCWGDNLTHAEIEFLDRGADYLMQRQLYRAASTRAVIDDAWLKLTFPRFYFYDALRGLSFLLAWALRLKRRLPLAAINECVELIDGEFSNGRIRVQRAAWAGATSRFRNHSDLSWHRGAAESHPLLNAVSEIGSESPYLTECWIRARTNLLGLIEQGLIESGE